MNIEAYSGFSIRSIELREKEVVIRLDGATTLTFRQGPDRMHCFVKRTEHHPVVIEKELFS